MSTNQTKNKDILKTISERFIKPKVTENTVDIVTETQVKVDVTPVETHRALDVVQVGRDYLIVELEYDLNTMTAKIVSSTNLDNRVAGLSFQHGKTGLDSVVRRSKLKGETK